MKKFCTDEELLAARDVAFQKCRCENISATIACLAKRKEIEVVELDFSIRVDEKVVLVDKISYVDSDSFRLDYSDSDFYGDDESSAGNIGRLAGRTHSVVVRQGDFKVETELSIESLIHLRFLTEFMARVGDSEFTDNEFEKEVKGKSMAELMAVMFAM